jgi:hypothetical protein
MHWLRRVCLRLPGQLGDGRKQEQAEKNQFKGDRLQPGGRGFLPCALHKDKESLVDVEAAINRNSIKLSPKNKFKIAKTNSFHEGPSDRQIS